MIPAFLIIFELLHDYGLYKQMQAGINHLQAAVTVFHDTSGGAEGALDAGKLHQAQQEIDIAHTDFTSLNTTLAQDNSLALASPFLPTQVSSARALSQIAADGTSAAQDVLKTLSDISPSILLALKNTPPSTAAPTLAPYITPASYQEITQTLDAIAPLIHRMALNAQGVSLNSLPLSSKQHAILAELLPLLPVLDSALQQRSAFQKPLGWFLGIDSQRTFLVEPMDNTELRAAGGFTGQFGELVLNGGHIGPLKLANLGIYEEDHTDEGAPPDYTILRKVIGQSAPAPYSDWWPIPNFGVRDANLSADFPTSAKIVMQRYNYEFDKNVDGVIMFTPRLIEQVLHITGPITIPLYKQTVTE
ncbi:MAG TPA: DUF4012 domain-containing protein, partial [Ktedonobacterales bacterium]